MTRAIIRETKARYPCWPAACASWSVRCWLLLATSNINELAKTRHRSLATFSIAYFFSLFFPLK